MTTDNPTIRLANLLLPRDVGRLVGNKPCQSCEMPRFAPSFCKHLDNIRECPLRLPDEIVADQLTALIPANLAGNANLAPLAGTSLLPALRRPPALAPQTLQLVHTS